MFKRSNLMTSTNEKIQQNKIILKQLQNSLKRKQVENFATIVRAFSILIKSTKIRNMNQSLAAFSKTFEKYKILMCDIEFMIEIFKRNFYINGIMINEKAYHNESDSNMMNLTRQMLFNDKYAAHIRTKLVTFTNDLTYEK